MAVADMNNVDIIILEPPDAVDEHRSSLILDGHGGRWGGETLPTSLPVTVPGQRARTQGGEGQRGLKGAEGTLLYQRVYRSYRYRRLQLVRIQGGGGVLDVIAGVPRVGDHGGTRLGRGIKGASHSAWT